MGEYVRKWTKCQLNEVLKAKKKSITTATHPFEMCSLDYVGPLVESESGSKYMLTFQDEWSKFTVATQFPQQDAETFAKANVLNIVSKLGAAVSCELSSVMSASLHALSGDL
jgi:hypothetical protein